MKRLVLVVLVVALVGLMGGVAWADVVGLIHWHTRSSDGLDYLPDAVATAAKEGAKFLITTDHAEHINDLHSTYDRYSRIPGTERPMIVFEKLVGYEAWRQAIEEASRRSYITVIPGMEVGLGEGRKSHLLFLGGNLEVYRQVIKIAEEQAVKLPKNALTSLEALARSSGAVLVLAHPVDPLYPFRVSLPPKIAGVSMGVEFFNGIGSDNGGTFGFLSYLSNSLNSPAIATAGVDFHGDIGNYLKDLGGFALDIVKSPTATPKDYDPPYRRFTVVRTDSTEPGEIMRCIREGKCYAAFGPARIASASAWPGEKYNPAVSPIFRMRITGQSGLLVKSTYIAVVSKKPEIGKPIHSSEGVVADLENISIDLRKMLGVESGGEGWWLSIGTDQIAHSMIEILPFPQKPQQVVEGPKTSKEQPIPGTGTPQPPGAPVQLGEGLILFLGRVGQGADNVLSMYLIGPDGSGLHRIVPMSSFLTINHRPMLSFDRGRIAVAWKWPKILNYLGVWVMGLDGSNPIMVTPTEGRAEVWDATDVDWSPDGARIAFSQGQREGISLVEGGGIRQIPLHLRPNGLCWSRDGRKIAFYVWPRGIWVFDLATGNLTRVLENGVWPSWSPDSSQLVFEDEDKPGGRIGILSLADGAIRSIAEGRQPFWSPDGTRIVYLGERKQIIIHDLASGANRVIWGGDVSYVCWR